MASITKRVSARVVVDEKTGKKKTVTTERYRARCRDEAGKATFRLWFTRWSEVQDWTDGTAATAALTLASVTFADVPMNRTTPLHVEAWMKAMTKPGPLQLRPHGLPGRRQGAGDPAGPDGGNHATSGRKVGGEAQAPESRTSRSRTARGARRLPCVRGGVRLRWPAPW